jgi:capsular polysaccharide biosynthesis protein
MTSAERSASDELFWITDYWTHNYFHWCTDALSKLYLVCASFDNPRILLPKEYRALDFVRQSLHSFPEADVAYVPDEKSISVKRLQLLSYIATPGNFNLKIINEIRTRLLRDFAGHNMDSEAHRKAEGKIYISRAKADKRKIVNEISVLNTVEKLGYQIAITEDLSFIDQIQLMHRSKVILGLHGAGLTNMLFMPTGSVVVEIRKEGDTHNNCYFSLSSALGHRYYYVVAQSSSPSDTGSNDKSYFTEDVFVDIAHLSTVLRQVDDT